MRRPQAKAFQHRNPSSSRNELALVSWPWSLAESSHGKHGLGINLAMGFRARQLELSVLSAADLRSTFS